MNIFNKYRAVYWVEMPSRFTGEQRSLYTRDAIAQAMVSSEEQLGWLGQPGGRGTIFEEGP